MLTKNFIICHRGALGDFILAWPAILCLRKKLSGYRFIGIGRPEYMRLGIRFGMVDLIVDMESAEMPEFFEGQKIPEQMPHADGGIFWLKEDKILRLFPERSELPFAVIPPFPGEKEKIHVGKYHLEMTEKYFSVDVPDDVSDILPVRDKKGKGVLIHPGSGSVKKNCSPEFYMETISELRRKGFGDIKIVLGPAEFERGTEKCFKNEKIAAPENAGMLAGLLDSAELYIGNDSGVSHLAGFIGTPSVVFYKNTDPEIWGVLGRNVNIIRTENEADAIKNLKNFMVNF